jgi:hypothetical protein
MTHYAPTAATVTRAERKLASFSELPVGWHYGRGGPISRPVLERAVAVAQHLIMAGFSRNDAFPGVDGDVQVTGYHGRHFISIDIMSGDRFDVRHDIGGIEHCCVEGVGWPGVKIVINEVATEVWGISGLFTLGTGIPYVAVSAISHSRSHPTAASQSSRSTARKPRADRSARTLERSIPA